MDTFIQQAFFLLTTSPGNMAYHLVLAFSLVAALISAINSWQRDQKIVGRRMVFGLITLLGLRFLLFFSAALAWQELIDPNLSLLVLDWVVGLLSLLLIIWLWAFPEPVRLADTVTGGLIALLALLGFYNLLMNQVQNLPDPFILLSNELTIEILGILFCLIGGLILITRRPVGWFIGLIMLGILGAGYAIQWFFIVPGSGYAGAVRLAEMIAYPLLIALPQRYASVKAAPALDQAASPDVDTVTWLQSEGIQEGSADPKIQSIILALLEEKDSQSLGYMIAEIIGRAMQADICLLLLPPEENGQLRVSNGYELMNQRRLLPVSLERKNVPLLDDAFARGRVLRLPENTSAPDLVSLAKVLKLQKTGALLTQPLQDADGAPFIEIVLLLPRAHHSWTLQDQDRLLTLAEPLGNYLQRSLRKTNLEQDDPGNPSVE
jgi:hypothetical protein